MISVLLLLLQDTGEEFWKFKPGTKWTFQMTGERESRTMVMTALKEEDGKLRVESKEFGADKERPGKEQTLLFYAADGYVIYSELSGGKEVDPLRLLKIGAKKGDTWTTEGVGRKEATVTHLGASTLKVPAGEYKDVVQVRIDTGEGALDFYLAPKIGLVKAEISMGGKVGVTIELTKHEAGK
jgi:hypothetical protein